MLHTRHMSLEGIKTRAKCNIRAKLVPLSDSAGKEGVVLISVMFADRYVPMRMSTMQYTSVGNKERGGDLNLFITNFPQHGQAYVYPALFQRAPLELVKHGRY